MTEIHVHDLFGSICIDSDDGAKLCDLAHDALDHGEIVCLNFTGVTTLASAFLNTAVGCLYSFFSKDDLDQRLKWNGLDETDQGVMRFVQRNAIRFYSASQSNKEALLSSSTRLAEE